MTTIPIDDVDDPRLAEYRNVPDPELVRRRGLFVVEGRLVVRRFLEASPLVARSVLVTPAALEAVSDLLAGGHAELPMFVVPQAVMNAVSGFNIHRGCLALGQRPAPATVKDLLARVGARRLVVLEAVSNADNVGGIFRSAAALGADGVVLGPGCCDPLYRKAIRTSIGMTLTLPFASADAWPAAIHSLADAGYTIAALTPAATARPLPDAEIELVHRPRLALLVGAEGPGLSPEALAAAPVHVRIPITAAVDSLNVTVAASIALQRLCGGDGLPR